jgi:hypothetical protein
MEEFNLEFSLDEAAEARIAHAEFLNKIKDWGLNIGKFIGPMTAMAETLMNDDYEDIDFKAMQAIFPKFMASLVEEFNNLYVLMQNEANKVLGAPFALFTEHHHDCDGTDKVCGHQEHYTEEK